MVLAPEKVMTSTSVETRKKVSRIVAGGMLRENTPVQDYTKQYGIFVKREDLSCPPPGPRFSKARGVYAWVKSRQEDIIGVLDTSHSQAGHAVARACQILGKKCINYYPEFKGNPGPKDPQREAKSLGAELVGLPAGRSSILYHQAKKLCLLRRGAMIPNALKLQESVDETAKEVDPSQAYNYVLIPISSGTIAAGVIRGFSTAAAQPRFIIHLGYTRSHEQVERYLARASGIDTYNCVLVDEEYEYKDEAIDGETPPWPCSPWYDLKAFRWWLNNRQRFPGSTLFWNIG